MEFYRSQSLFLLISVMASVSCSTGTVSPSSSTGALTANSAIEGLARRPFDRQTLSVSNLHTLNEFIRSDVRSRLDEEPAGDAENGYDAPTFDTSVSTDQPQTQPDSGEASSEPVQQEEFNEDTSSVVAMDSKFHWVKKSFGDAVKATPESNGAIVLYADENIYDIHAMMRFIEEGRGRVAEVSEIDAGRIHVLFGGYRAVPQVESWVIPAGGTLPEFKPDDRAKANEPEN